MTDINNVVIVGRLTRDCGADQQSFGYTRGGSAVAKVSIACNRSRKQQDGNWVEDVSYFEVTIFGKVAESLKPYLVKGQQIAVQGHLNQDRWEKDGQRFSRVGIIADNIQLLGGRSQNGNMQNEAPESQYGSMGYQQSGSPSMGTPQNYQQGNVPNMGNQQQNAGYPPADPYSACGNSGIPEDYIF